MDDRQRADLAAWEDDVSSVVDPELRERLVEAVADRVRAAIDEVAEASARAASRAELLRLRRELGELSSRARSVEAEMDRLVGDLERRLGGLGDDRRPEPPAFAPPPRTGEVDILSEE